ncbi:MAG: TetR/AcrR family transcriptional regulator [Erysipelothrix sp.]|nr:TetR/AcrR family transcriptional regulator [Erysipelothrix sp.]
MEKQTTRMTKEDRQKQILSAAINVFVEKGYNGATTLEIAKAANISEVTLFRHFDSKKDIFRLSVEPIVFTTLKESITASKNLTKKQQLEYILFERIKLVSKNREVIKLLLMESQINTDLEGINYIEKISLILKETIKNIGLSIDDEQFVMRVLIGGILSFLYLPEQDEERINSFIQETINLIIKD